MTWADALETLGELYERSEAPKDRAALLIAASAVTVLRDHHTKRGGR